jgi:prevent-host-death family protein
MATSESEKREPRRVTSTEAQQRFGELLDDVLCGQRVVITKYGRPVVEVVRIDPADRGEAAA